MISPQRLTAVIATAVLLIDQITKGAVRAGIPLHREVPLLPFFSLTHVRNTGAAFGIMTDSNLFFIFTTVLILAVLAVTYNRIVEGRAGPAAFGDGGSGSGVRRLHAARIAIVSTAHETRNMSTPWARRRREGYQAGAPAPNPVDCALNPLIMGV